MQIIHCFLCNLAVPYLYGGGTVAIYYKFDVIAALKDAGYNTNRLRKEKLLSEGVLQSLRENKAISLANIDRICELLNCQPGDILGYTKKED